MQGYKYKSLTHEFRNVYKYKHFGIYQAEVRHLFHA